MTYLGLNAVVLGATAVLAFVLRPGPGPRGAALRAVLATVGVLVLLTLVFDNVMIAAGLVAYDPALLSGFMVGVAPVEDLGYVVGAALLLPALWQALARRGEALERTGSALVLSSRPLSWINTAYPFGAAYLMTAAQADATFWIGSLFFLVPYNLAMYGINDVFDYESDLRNPRKGGVEGAILDRSHHRTTVVAAVASCAPFMAYLYWVGNLASAVVLTVVMFAVLAYSFKGLRFKEVPFLDSVTSSTHFVGPAVFGLAVAGSDWSWPVTGSMVAFFAWGVASQSFGAVQDIVSDREAGLGSIATVLGARRTVRFAAGAYLLASAVLLTVGWPGALAALVPLPYLANVLRFRHLTDETSEEAHAGWERFLWLNYLAGFLITLLLITLALG